MFAYETTTIDSDFILIEVRSPHGHQRRIIRKSNVYEVFEHKFSTIKLIDGGLITDVITPFNDLIELLDVTLMETNDNINNN